MRSVQIEERHYSLIKSILNKFSVQAWAFGSRAKGHAKSLSDLDLVIKEKIESRRLAQLKAAFEDSQIPYKIDIILWDEIDPQFLLSIEKDLVKF